MADTPILNYKGKYDGPEIDKAVELALGLDNPKSCPYYVHVSLSKPDYVLTIGLGDAEGNLFNHAEIDLPLESMVVNATYENGNIILHLQDGTSTEPIPISALIAGLVSETRTIAGIDLKDNITQKELRDALDVYTKDSVDQLVSDLENRIDETLNDLSDLTSEHDTQIKKNTSDIAVNRTTLGYQGKNLLNHTAKTETVDGVNITVNADRSITFSGTFAGTDIRYHQIYKNADGSNKTIGKGKYIVSGGAEEFGFFVKHGTNFSGNNGKQFNVKTSDVPITIENETERIEFFVSLSPAREYNATIYPMLRSADIADDTYEPYVPSVNERLTEVEETVSELTPQVEQNKSDISSRLPWRYGAANANENVNKWYRLGRFETTTMNNTFNSILLVHDRRGRENGILTITIEKKNNAETDIPSAFDSEIKGEWISAETQTNSTFQKRNNFVIVAWVEDTKLICELWCKIYQAWNVYYALQLANNRMATDVSKITSNPELGWVLEVTRTPYDRHPLASDTVRVVQTSDKLAEALTKINDLETDRSTYALKEVVDLLHGATSYTATTSGTFTSSGPTTSETASTRIRTDVITVKAGDVIRITNGSLYHMCGIWKDSISLANNVRNDTSTITKDETFRIENDGYIVIAFRNTKNTTLSPSEFDGSITLYR